MTNAKPKVCGIYTIRNLINGKMYVGYGIDIVRRFYSHSSRLRRNVHCNEHLQSSVNEYGFENFIFEVLEDCSEEYLAATEHYWVNTLKNLQ